MNFPQLPIFITEDKNFGLMQTSWASILNKLAKYALTLVSGAENLGTGAGLFAQDSANILQFKSLVAGSNVTLTESSDSITIAASGGGGGSTPVVSSSCGAFTTSSATPVDVTNLSVPITTTGGSVELQIQSDGGLTAAGFQNPGTTMNVFFLRDGSVISSQQITTTFPADTVFPVSMFAHKDVSPAAGAHTYKVQAQSDGAVNLQLFQAVLVAQEV